MISVPDKYNSVSDLVRELDLSDADISKTARRWVAENFYADRKKSIQYLRLYADMSLQQLAQKANIAEDRLVQIENGSMPNPVELVTLATTLGVTEETIKEGIEC